MWIAEACFEGREEPIKKLLLPGKQYRVGRKGPAELVLQNKSVSQDAGSFEIAAWSPAQRSIRDASALPDWPKAFLNVGKKNIRFVPASVVEAYNAHPTGFGFQLAEAESTHEVESDDLFVFSIGCSPVRMFWQPLLLWVAPGTLQDRELRQTHAELAKRGIGIVAQDKEVLGASHYVVDAAEPTAAFLHALVLGISIVSSDFIEEIRHAAPETYELEVCIPDEGIFFPESTPLDDATYQELKASVKSRASRASLLQGITLLLLMGKKGNAEAFQPLSHVYELAGARIEQASPQVLKKLTTKEAASSYLKERLRSAGNDGSRRCANLTSSLIIITSVQDFDSQWYPHIARISRELSIPMPANGPDALVQAVLVNDVGRFLGEFASFQPEEAETELPPSDANDQVTSKGNVVEMQTQIRTSTTQPIAPPTPSRKPKRRAGLERADPFADVFGSAAEPSQTGARLQLNLSSQVSELGPTPEVRSSEAAPATKPRRNVSNEREKARRSDVWQSMLKDNSEVPASSQAAEDITQERYSLRFRRELDNLDRQATQRAERASEAATQDDRDVAVIAAARKRKAVDEVTDERENVQSPDPKPRSLEARETSPPQAKPAAPVKESKGDAKDDRFLLSLATMKKNRKKMDEMDEEFDKLRLVRPKVNDKQGGAVSRLMDRSLLDDAEYRAWQEMSIDDFSMGAAGNFVQVDFVPLLRKDKPAGPRQAVATSSAVSAAPAWTNRPNFKKFQSKGRARSKPIEMVLSKVDDFGLGTHYGSSRAAESVRAGNAPKATQKRSIYTQLSGERTTGRNEVPRRQPGQGQIAGASNEVDLDIDVDDTLNIDDSSLFDDDEELSQQPASARSSTIPSISQKRGRGRSTQADVVDLIDSDDDDSDDGSRRRGGGSTGFSFKGFKSSRAQDVSSRR